MDNFFVVNPFEKWKPTDIPNNCHVNIAVGAYATSPTGELLLTENLMSDQEVDHAIDRLKKQLEKVRNEAKKKIKVTNARILEAVKSRTRTE